MLAPTYVSGLKLIKSPLNDLNEGKYTLGVEMLLIFSLHHFVLSEK